MVVSTTEIGKCQLFSGLDLKTLAKVTAIAEERRVDGSSIVFLEGDDASVFFILASGQIDLVKTTPDGREHVIRSVRTGETFAEAAVFAGKTYPATAVARKKAILIAIRKDKFLALIRTNPDISLKMMSTMAELLRHLNALAESMGSSVADRLMVFLRRRAKESGAKRFPLGIQKRELASRLGTIPETLSRTFKKLEQGGVIKLRGKMVELKK